MKSWRSQRLPLRVLPLLCWPALSSRPGQIPAHDAKCLAPGKWFISRPISTGSTSAARRLTTRLPAITLAEAIETTRIHRVAGLTGDRTALVTTRPFRAPHHTLSDLGLIGGGHVPMPGDVSLAHNGVLFLDELPEFRRHVLEVLRQPLEESVTGIQSPARHESLYYDALCGSDNDHKRLGQRGVGTHHHGGVNLSPVDIIN
jgi:Magnesium chelatase, subunit ChlI